MHYDLIIIGGGLVGAGLAAALRDSDKRIALIDARMPSNEDPRLFALNHGSCAVLKNLGLWPQLTSHAEAIHQVHVSKRGQFGAVRLHREDVALAYLGYVIPACYIEAALNALLLSLENVTIYRPAVLTELTQQADMNQVTINIDGEFVSMTSPIVLGADGTESTVRAQLKIDAEVIEYGQHAIVTRTELQRHHRHVAYERFNEHGAIAMLPLAENECATIWTADQSAAASLMALSDADFLQALQREFGYRLGRLMSIKRRHTFPLRMVRAKQNVKAGVMLLGNAAHTLHPIAAQGFNVALYEVATLAEILRQENTVDLHAVWLQVEKQMGASMTMSHQLADLFNHSSLLLKYVLPIGMVGLDKTPALKRLFMTKLLGRSGRVPPLLSANEG